MKVRAITGKQGRPKIVELMVTNDAHIAQLKVGKWKLLEATPEETEYLKAHTELQVVV